jgi:hypothetical protein
MQDFTALERTPAGASNHAIPGPTTQKPSLIFIDPSAKDMSAQIVAAGEKADLIFLSARRDGLQQIAGHLDGRGRLSLIHLLADFALGRLALGDKVLVVRSLRDYAATLARIGEAVRGCGEIVIGAGGLGDGQGENFRGAFEAHTGAPVRLWDDRSRRHA